MTNFLRNISNRHFNRVDLVKPRIKGVYEGMPNNTSSFINVQKQLDQKEFLPDDYSGNKASELSIGSKKSSAEDSFNVRNTKSRKSDTVKETKKILVPHRRMKDEDKIVPLDDRHLRHNFPIVATATTDNIEIKTKQHVGKEALSDKSDIESVKKKVVPSDRPGMKSREFNAGKEYSASDKIKEKEDGFSKDPQIRDIKENNRYNNVDFQSGEVKDARTEEMETRKSIVPSDDRGSADHALHHEKTSLNQNMHFNIFEGNPGQRSNQIIRVNIGQIEIKAVEEEKPVVNKPITGFRPKISLSEYLKKDNKV